MSPKVDYQEGAHQGSVRGGKLGPEWFQNVAAKRSLAGRPPWHCLVTPWDSFKGPSWTLWEPCGCSNCAGNMVPKWVPIRIVVICLIIFLIFPASCLGLISNCLFDGFGIDSSIILMINLHMLGYLFEASLFG